MVEPMTLCSFLMSTLIVGAVETRPGIMHLTLLNEGTATTQATFEELYVYTGDYVQCWNNGIPVQPAGPTDSGGDVTPSNS